MLHAAPAETGGLEVRAEKDGSAVIEGAFPYNTTTELSPRRREVFQSLSFRRRIQSGEQIDLLVAHDFSRPLASTRAGTLTLDDGEDALRFEARISARLIADSPHVRDALALIHGRLATGLSPGFTTKRGDEVIESSGGGLLRTVIAADLHELSIVVRPAYDAAQVEARAWWPIVRPQRPAVLRWRA